MSVKKTSPTLIGLSVCLAVIAAACAAATPAPPPQAATVAPSLTAAAPSEAATTAPAAPAATQTLPSPATEQAATTGPAWVRLDVAEAPPARFDHSIVLDPEGARLILFGGRGSSGGLKDIWIFDLNANTWRQVAAVGPSARWGHGAVYDAARRQMVVFGGQAGGLFNDIWIFDAVSETWREVSAPDPRPDVRYGFGAALDVAHGRMLVSHGFASDGRHDDTWALDLSANTWENVTPTADRPLKRCLLDMAFDPARGTAYLFGGCSSGFGPCPQGDLWAFDAASDRWTQITSAGESPGPRQNPSLVVGAGFVGAFPYHERIETA